MSTRIGLLVVGILGLVWSPARAADRLTDRDVKALVERIDENRDRFKDALDDKVKNEVVRGTSGEVDVKRYLEDFKENIGRLKDRMKPEYAASTEAAAVLRQGSAIERFFRSQSPGVRGESEWNRLASDLAALARAYGAEFPLDEQTPVRRIGDGELVIAIGAVAQAADRLKKSLDQDLKKDPSVDKPSRESAVARADELAKEAKALRDRVKDGKPSSSEAERLLADAGKVREFIGSHKTPASAGVWAQTPAPLQTIAAAYGASRPGTW